MKRSEHIDVRITTSVNHNIVQQKVINTILSCTTMEQLKNTRQWFFWVFDVDNIIKYGNKSGMGVVSVFLNLFEVKRNELKNKDNEDSI